MESAEATPGLAPRESTRMGGRALVTGGAGFVGAALVEALRARDADVRILDLAPPPENADGGDYLQGSVADAGVAARAVEGVDAVYHLAGLADLWARDPGLFETVNHQGTRVMLKAAKAAGVRKFVHCSSATTLIGADTPPGDIEVDEAAAPALSDMLGPYPRSKFLAEEAVRAAAADGLNAVIVNPTEPIGPGDEGLTPPTRMIIDYLRGKTPAYIDCVLNFAPTGSLAEGFIAAAEKGRAGERYLLCGDNVALSDLLAMLTKLTGRPTPKVKLPYWVALLAGAVDTGLVAQVTGKPPKAPLTGVRLAGRRARFSGAKAARELGWTAEPFEPALIALLDWADRENLV